MRVPLRSLWLGAVLGLGAAAWSAPTVDPLNVKANVRPVPSSANLAPVTLVDDIGNLRYWLLSPNAANPGHTHDGRYYPKATVDQKLDALRATIPPAGGLPVHDHDGRYYPREALDILFSGKLSTAGGTLTGPLAVRDTLWVHGTDASSSLTGTSLSFLRNNVTGLLSWDGAMFRLNRPLSVEGDLAVSGTLLATLSPQSIPDLSATYALTGHAHGGLYQPQDGDLSAIAALQPTTTGQILRWDQGAGAWVLGTESGGSGGANASGYYLVSRATDAPANAVNLGLLPTGLLKVTVAGGVATLSADATLYLSVADAAATYATQAALSGYLTNATAASTYLSQAAAASLYQPRDDALTQLASLSPTAAGQVIKWDQTAGAWVLGTDDIGLSGAPPTTNLLAGDGSGGLSDSGRAALTLADLASDNVFTGLTTLAGGLKIGTASTPGYVWKATDTQGNGTWQPDQTSETGLAGGEASVEVGNTYVDVLFATPFATAPRVTLTPTQNTTQSGVNVYWVTGTTVNGFRIQCDSPVDTSALNFNWLALP